LFKNFNWIYINQWPIQTPSKLKVPGCEKACGSIYRSPKITQGPS